MGIACRFVEGCCQVAVRLVESHRLVDGDRNCRRFSSSCECWARSEARCHVCQGSKHYICACELRYSSFRKSSLPGEGFSFSKIVFCASTVWRRGNVIG